MISSLEAWGCNVQEALERFVDDKELYIMCMNLFVNDASFGALGDAIKSKNYKAAFEAAHTLKGVAGNVGAGPLYEIVGSLTDRLRADDYAGLESDYQKIMGYKEELRAILEG